MRGVRTDAACPECGHPVAETLRGAAIEAGRREHGADAFRTFGRSFLLTAPAGVAAIGCLSGPIWVLATVGAVQRLVALRTADGCLPRAAFAELPERRRSWVAAIATVAVAMPCVVLVSTGLVDRLPTLLAASLGIALPALWFGTAALELVCGTLLTQRVDERFATGLERTTWPMVAPFAAVGCQLLADASAPLLGGWSAIPRLLAIAAWITAAALTAWDASGTGEELAGEPVERTLKAPSDAAETIAPAGPDLDPGIVRAARERRPDDDAPIPID